MTKTIRILTLLALMVIGAGQAWAETVELGKIIYTQGDNDGGTLQFYEDLACNNKITLTNGKSSALSVGTVYIKATPEFGYAFDIADEGSKVTFITAEVTAGTGAAGARTRNGEANIEVGGFIDVTATATKGVYQITMPADENFNVTLTATFPEKDYLTGVNYIDIDGQTKQAEAYVLDGTEEVLGEPGGTSSSPKETWYVCDKNLSYTTFNFSSNCNVNIILADNVEMSVINSNGDAISNSNYSSPDSQDSFGVYGQSKGSDRGALTVKCTSSGGNAIDITGGVIISHCNLTAEGDGFGIRANGSGKDVTIRDAEVTANAGTYGFAIYSSNGGVSITGGTVTAESGSFGIRADGSGKDVTIIGAEVIANATATGGYAIYSDYGGVSITGGTVTAEGDVFGIRANGSGKDVTITGAEVTANAGTGGFAIYSSNGGVSITGGTVTAESGSFGIRASGSGKDVTITGDAEVKATATDGYAIDSSKGGVSITGGTVIAEGSDTGIRAEGSDKDVTISGAEVNAIATDGFAIDSSNGGISITGGTVIAEGKYFGIRASGSGKDVTISNAKVTATATDDSAIRSYSGGVSITGGTVIADGTTGITSSDDIVLGWTDANDYIKASSYSVGSNKAVKTADGQRFVAYTPGATESDPMTATAIVSGSIAKENGSYPIDGKTLKPLDGYTVTLADDISLMDGTTAKTPDFTIGTTPYYIYKASTEQNPVTLTLSYDGTDFVTVGGLPEGTTLDAVENQPLQRSFAMPAQDVALTATAVTGLTASGTYTYTGSPQTPDINLGESAFEATNYSVTGITPKEGSNSELTDGKAVDVGEYSLAITGLGQYIGPASVDFTIGKADYDGTTTALGYVCYGQVTADAKLTLPDLPDGASYATTGNVGGDSPALIDGAPTVSGTTLTYNTTSQDEGTSATITIGVTGAKNYNDYDVVVTVKANIIENDNGTVVTKIGDDTYNVSIDEGDGSGGVIVIPGGGNSIDVADLDYSRTLTAPTESNKDAIIGGNVAKLYTTCQPTVPATNANVKYFTLTSVSGTTLNFEEVTTPAKDTPYLMAVMGNSDIPERVTAENETLTLKKLVTGTPVSGYTMMGTQTGLSNADAISAANGSNVTYILQAQSTWGKVTNKAGVYIPPFRAFIVGPAVNTGNAARQLNNSFDDDDATGIDSIRTIDSDGTECWYDLNGRRIDKPTSTQKGVYIQSGRKVVVK